MTTTVPPLVDVVFTVHPVTVEVVVEAGADVLVELDPVVIVVAPGTVVLVGAELVVVVARVVGV